MENSSTSEISLSKIKGQLEAERAIVMWLATGQKSLINKKHLELNKRA